MNAEKSQDRCLPGFEHGLDQDVIEQFKDVVFRSEDQVRGIFPTLKKDIQYVWFNQDSDMVVPQYVTGGFLYQPNIVSIAIDDTFSDAERLERELRLTIFHELFHVMQGFSAFDENGEHQGFIPVIGNALYEGAASIFERDFAQIDGHEATLPYYADYTLHDEIQLTDWANALIDLGTVRDVELLNQWKFYHDELKVNHIMYKVGAYLIDTVLDHDPEVAAVDRLAQEDWKITLDRYKRIISTFS